MASESSGSAFRQCRGVMRGDESERFAELPSNMATLPGTTDFVGSSIPEAYDRPPITSCNLLSTTHASSLCTAPVVAGQKQLLDDLRRWEDEPLSDFETSTYDAKLIPRAIREIRALTCSASEIPKDNIRHILDEAKIDLEKLMVDCPFRVAAEGDSA